MVTVGHGAIASNIDPRVPGAGDHVTLQGGLTCDVECRTADRLCKGRKRHSKTKDKRRNSQKNAGDLLSSGYLPVNPAGRALGDSFCEPEA